MHTLYRCGLHKSIFERYRKGYAAIQVGAHVLWDDKLSNGTLADADVLGLAVKYTVAVNR